MIPVFIGHDRREEAAYAVCEASLRRHASAPVQVTALTIAAVTRAGLYRRYASRQGAQRVDLVDGKPFSTDFSFTRFLVPALALWQGWALFCDCDFLWREDVARLWRHRDERYAAMVVKHQHVPAEATKMDGVAQTAYRRKNWSSLVLWNCAHPAHARLSVADVNQAPGAWLHAFEWLADDEIGALPHRWNWLAGSSPPLSDNAPAAVHFTLGTPDMPGCGEMPYAGEWWSLRAECATAAPQFSALVPPGEERWHA